MIYNKDYPYSFDESKCKSCGGKCCTGKSGYIFVTSDEIIQLSQLKQLNFNDFVNKYCIKVGVRFSLIEKPYKDGFACIFFDEVNKNCGVYEARPNQCRTFPFWEYFKSNLKELKKECIGVN